MTSSASCSLLQASGAKLAATSAFTARSNVSPFPFKARCNLFSNLRGRKCAFQRLFTVRSKLGDMTNEMQSVLRRYIHEQSQTSDSPFDVPKAYVRSIKQSLTLQMVSK